MTKEVATNDVSMATEAPGAPVTSERKLNPDLQDQLQKPYLARALAAVDPISPNGTEGYDNRGLSVMQQHASFFDRNKDGIVYPCETYKGLRALGFGLCTSLFSAVFINFILSYPTQLCWIPSPFLPIHIKNTHKAKHGSDTQTYDHEGRFNPTKLDEIFSKYALTHGNALTYKEMIKMLKGNADLYDFFGQFGAFFEWHLLYHIGKDKNGLLHRDIVRGCFDGSLFYKLETKKKA